MSHYGYSQLGNHSAQRDAADYEPRIQETSNAQDFPRQFDRVYPVVVID